MKVTSDRSTDLIVTEGFAKRSWRPHASIARAKARRGERVEATGVSEARLVGSEGNKTPPMNPSGPAEAGRAS